MKPKIFIGSSSSSEGLDVANAIHDALQRDAEITVWNQNLFGLSKIVYEQLLKKTVETDFAIFVFTPDDVLKIRDAKFVSARDNVIFEFGLFLGKLGKERTFFLVPESQTNLRIPTDLLGVVYGTYEDKRSDSNLTAGVGPFCNRVRTKINKYLTEQKNKVSKYDAQFVSTVTNSSRFEGSPAFYDEFNNHLRNTTDSIVQVGSGFHCVNIEGIRLAESYLRVLSGCALRHKYVRIELAKPNMKYWGKLLIDHLAPMKNVEILLPSNNGRYSFLLKDVCLMDPGTDRAVVELMLPAQEISPTADCVIEVVGEGIFIRSKKIADSFARLIFQLREEKVVVKATIDDLMEYFGLDNDTSTDDDKDLLYFAYGSNMLNEQMHDRVSSSKLIGPVRLPGYKVCFNIPGTIFKNSVCNIVQDASSEVWGILYRAGEREFIRRMDFYEGVAHGEYERQKVEVIQANGETISAFTYLNKIKANETAPSSLYLDIMLRGAKQGGLPKEYILRLEEWKNAAT